MKNYIFGLLTIMTLSTLPNTTIEAETTTMHYLQSETIANSNSMNATGIVVFVVIMQILMIVLFYKIKMNWSANQAKSNYTSLHEPLEVFPSKDENKDWRFISVSNPIFSLQHI